MSPLLVAFAATFGAAAAAFLPRVAHRLAVGFATAPRPACAVCSRPFPAGLDGWVRAGPACPCSGGHAPAVLAGAAVSALLAAAIGPAPLLPVYLLGAVLGLALAMLDRRCRRLPDPLVGALAIVVGVPSAVLRPDGIGRGLLAGGVVFVAYVLVAALPRGGLGLGDVKLAAVLALILGFAGWPAVVVGVLAAHLINGSVALFLLVTRRIRRDCALPFGPALLAGALIALTTA